MPENSNCGGIWKALAEFLCVLTPEQYILLPTLLAANVFCTTNEDEQNLISNFFAVLGQALSAITSHGGICIKNTANNCKTNDKKNGNGENEGEDSIERVDNNNGNKGSTRSSAAQTMTFE